MNERLNFSEGGHANAVWQFHLDLIKKRSRFSFNYLFDDLVFDPDIETPKSMLQHIPLDTLFLCYLQRSAC